MAKALPFASLLALAHELADLSEEAIRPYFRRAIAIEDKGLGKRFDPVTAADKAAERVIAKHLLAHWPEHGILGEELGRRAGAGRYEWVVDPIDGTKGFLVGSPMWGTLIGLMDGGTPCLGLMNQPFTRERIWSGKSGSSWRTADGKVRRLRTRACPSLGEAILMLTSPDFFAPGFETERFETVRGAVRMTRYGGDCYSYALLAAGHVDLVVEAGLKPYDIMALVPIIERAGGVVTTWDGGPPSDGGRIIAAGDRRVHAAALRLLAP